VAGVPVGYPHTPQGAAEAAGNYLTILNGPLMLDPAKLSAAIDEMAEPGARPQLESQSQVGRREAESLWGVQTARQQGQPFLFMTTPIAYRLASYTPQEARVSVWWVGNVGVAGHQRLIALFGVSTATLDWHNGDWRLRAYDSGSPSGDVVPALLQAPTVTDGIPSQLVEYVPYGSGS